MAANSASLGIQLREKRERGAPASASTRASKATSIFSEAAEPSDVDRELQRWRQELLHERLEAYSDDLAAWITNAVAYDPSMPPVRADKFLEDTRNGTALLHMARVIENGEKQWRRAQNMPERPATTFQIHEDAAPGSWKARDNVAQFLAWARRLGVPEVVLFETTDLTDAHNLRQVLHCLMDVARLQHGIEPPNLVKLELQLERALGGDENLAEAEDITPEIKALLRSMNMQESLADARDNMGRYYFGRKTPVFVRKLGKHLLVPLDDDWITLKHYLRLMEGNHERELAQISKRAMARAGAAEADLEKMREEERAKSKVREEERLKELNARMQQLRDAHEQSASTIAEKERELFAARERLAETQRQAEQAEQEAQARLRQLEDEKRAAAAKSEAALAEAMEKMRREQERQAAEREQRDKARRDSEAQVAALQRVLDAADERLQRLSKALKDEVQSKEKLVNELQETNEKLRDMRRKIVKERFGRAAQAGLASMRLKELAKERQDRAREADYVRQLERDRDEAERRAGEMETMAAEAIAAAMSQLGDLERSQSKILRRISSSDEQSAHSMQTESWTAHEPAISEAGETQESVARGASIHGGPMVTEARQGRPSSRGPEVQYDLASKPRSHTEQVNRKRFMLMGVREVVTVTRTKHFSDGREPVKTVERRQRELTPEEIKERCLDQEAYRLYEQQKRRGSAEEPIYARAASQTPRSSTIDMDALRTLLRSSSQHTSKASDAGTATSDVPVAGPVGTADAGAATTTFRTRPRTMATA